MPFPPRLAIAVALLALIPIGIFGMTRASVTVAVVTGLSVIVIVIALMIAFSPHSGGAHDQNGAGGTPVDHP